MLKLPKISLPAFSYEGVEFEPKTELHCSLLSTKVLAKEYFPHSLDKVSEDIKKSVQDYVLSHPIVYSGLKDQAYICQKDDAKSIIVGVKLQGIQKLFASLRAMFPELGALPDPLLHVTLYKYNHRYGIGIHNEAQLQELCQPLSFNELPSVVKETL